MKIETRDVHGNGNGKISFQHTSNRDVSACNTMQYVLPEASAMMKRKINEPDLKRYWDNYKKVKERIAVNGYSHLTATRRHLPYGITRYLPPDTSERAPP